jgi:hypothetical protein
MPHSASLIISFLILISTVIYSLCSYHLTELNSMELITVSVLDLDNPTPNSNL